MVSLKHYRVALAHHWFLTMSGGEKVCEAICEILDTPDLYSILADPDSLSPVLKKSVLKTSFIQNLPGSKKYYRYYAALFPLAVESFDLSSYELVISSDSSVVKGIKTQPETCHICFCHSPMRYAWNAFHDYTRNFGSIKKGLTSIVMSYLASYDYIASSRVDFFATPSETSRKRIQKYYRRDATVIHAPCDVDRFSSSSAFDDYYLFVGRLVDYKRADLAVKAFSKTGKRLLVVGTGPELNALKSFVTRNVEFLGWVDDSELPRLYSRCRALIFPGEEDFGIVPVEAQAAGRPVIAYGKGGALETVVQGETGIFFYEKSVESLIVAINEFEKMEDKFEPGKIVENAYRFSKSNFLNKFENYISRCINEHRSNFD